MRALHEHDRLAEAFSRTDQIHHFFIAARRRKRELHLAEDDDVKAQRRFAAAKQDLRAFRPHLLGARGNAIELVSGQLLEQRHVGEEDLHFDRCLEQDGTLCGML